jgi:cellulose synthase/poly-beta-1,6-N-acetylglucosamine synthase-like glycosyltransferase
MRLLYALIFALYAVVGAGLGYLYLLIVAGRRPRRSVAGAESGRLRFAITVPAHNEEKIIGARVTRLLGMDYPKDRFEVHVVADHCSDATASLARSAGATVHERNEGPRGRKGYALAWLLERLTAETQHYDAFVVFDADSQVAPDFLRWMERALSAGAQVAQGQHMIVNPKTSTFCALADGDMRLNNRIRNQAKENLGLSARLMGDAMCFSRQILETYPFRMASLTEDREYGVYLVAQGVRLRYVPQAVSMGQATARWSDATGQRLRWYGGAFEMQKRYLGPLLGAAWRHRSLDALDSAFELIVPPFSVLCVLAVGLVALESILRAVGVWSPLIPSVLLAAFAFAFPFLGLLAERAPRSAFRALISGPFYALWRIWVGVTVRLRRGRVPWIRTRRAEEEGSAL